MEHNVKAFGLIQVSNVPRKGINIRIYFSVFVSKLLALVLGATWHFDSGNLFERRSGKILWFLWSLRGANFMPTRTAEWAAMDIEIGKVELCLWQYFYSKFPTSLDTYNATWVFHNITSADIILLNLNLYVECGIAVRSVRCASRVRSDFHGKEVQLGQGGKVGNRARVITDSVNWGN